MKIRYHSLTGMPNVVLLHALGHPEYSRWADGQERDVPDDETVRWRIADRGPIRVVRSVDALLSCGPEFVDAATGKNPDFVCAVCGAVTTAGGFISPTAAAASSPTDAPALTPYENDQHDRLCPACYLVEHPDMIPHHVRLGFDQTVIGEVHARRSGEAARPLVALAPSGHAAAQLLEEHPHAIAAAGLPALSASDLAEPPPRAGGMPIMTGPAPLAEVPALDPVPALEPPPPVSPPPPLPTPPAGRTTPSEDVSAAPAPPPAAAPQES